jgi:hypothetical protein
LAEAAAQAGRLAPLCAVIANAYVSSRTLGDIPGCAGLEDRGSICMVRRRVVAIVALILCIPVFARAGSISLLGQGIQNGANGPSFVGFVRVIGGAGVSKAKVTAAIEGQSKTMVTASDVLGFYTIPGVGKGVNPDDVSVSCAKDGYKQANLVRKPHAASDTKDPVEVDCFLQKQ